MSDKPKFCKDCESHKLLLGGGYHHCARKEKMKTNHVTGIESLELVSCHVQRESFSDSACGPTGKFWEGKE